MQLSREFGYFCDIHFKIMTDNIIPRHIRFLGISYKYTLKKVYHFLNLTMLPMKFNIYKKLYGCKTLNFFNREGSGFLSNQGPDKRQNTKSLFSRQITLKAKKNLYL